MSIVTKIVFINLILVVVVAYTDYYLLDGLIEKGMPIYIAIWLMLSVLSIPFWLIYLVVMA